MTSGNKDSNKSDSGGSDDDDKGERAEKLLNMDRRHIGDKLMKKESSRIDGNFQRSSTDEALFLKNNFLKAPKKSFKVLNKQTSVGNVVQQL